MTSDKIISWSDYKREDGERTFGLLSQISPDGKYVLSTVKDRSVFVPVDNLEYSQLFFPIKGIIAVYDRTAKKFYALPGADDRSLVQSNPSWSPDGKEIIFARTSRYYSSAIENSSDILIQVGDAMEFVSRQKDFKFDLYRLDFNDGKGGKPVPIPGASGNNLSNYFARYSPDGKWIVFCQAKDFMLLQKDSKLYIMPAEGGEPRLMKCNTPNMNSWHTWSPNGKWLAFASKNKGPYTQLYLTHIDEQGNDSPAVLLENLIFNNKAVNIPEFVDDREHHLNKIVDSFSQTAYYYAAIAENDVYSREFLKAYSNLKEALKIDNAYFDAYMKRIVLNLRMGQTGTKDFYKDEETALVLINKEIQQKPADATLILKRANLEYLSGDYESALKDAMESAKINPDDYDNYVLLSSVYRKMGESQKTFDCYEKLLKMRPGDKLITYYKGLFYEDLREKDRAYGVFTELINNYPSEPAYSCSRAEILSLKGDNAGAKADLDKAISINATNSD
jgi:tetratricopeptide (TPR) repeat protein